MIVSDQIDGNGKKRDRRESRTGFARAQCPPCRDLKKAEGAICYHDAAASLARID